MGIRPNPFCSLLDPPLFVEAFLNATYSQSKGRKRDTICIEETLLAA